MLKKVVGRVVGGVLIAGVVTVLWSGAWAKQTPAPFNMQAQPSGRPLALTVPPSAPAPPANETLEQKVARLERENADLRREVSELQSELRLRRGEIPPSATPYPFNGLTYYYLPVQNTTKFQELTPSNSIGKTPEPTPQPKR
jgi:hypothetical protein